MNNTFSINRFGKVLAVDFRKYYKNFGITLIILSSLTVVLWLLTLVFGFTMPTLARWSMIYLAVFLAYIMVPAKAFGDINQPREGVRFAMLPASNLEKYLSYALFCLLTPVICIFLSWGIDSLLTALPIGGYNHYIQSLGFFGIWESFVTEVSEILGENASIEGFDEFRHLQDVFGSETLYNIILGIIFNTGIFMLGNLLFKKHKTAKTLACLIGVSYVLSMVMQLFMASKGIFPWMNKESVGISMDFEWFSNLAQSAMHISNILRTALTLALFVGIFYKLKNQKY